MWFFFGSITLLMSIFTVYVFRRRYARTGTHAQITIEIDGRQTEVAYESHQSTHKGSKTGYLIGISCPSKASFAIHRESGFDRFGKKLGVTREYSFHDRYLDKELFLDCNDPRIGQTFAASEDARSALKTLFNLLPHHFEIVLFQNRLWISVSGDDQTLPVGEYLQRMVQSLVLLSHALIHAMQGRGERVDPFLWRAGVVLATTLGTFVFGVFALIRIKSAPQLLNPGAMWIFGVCVGLLLTAVLFVLAWRWLKDSARAHYALLEVLLLGSVGLVLSATALLREANVDLDRKAPRVERIANVQAVHETYKCGKRKRHTCHRYYLGLPENKLGLERLKVDAQQYALLNQPTTIDVSVKPGMFAMDWIEKIERVEESALMPERM